MMGNNFENCTTEQHQQLLNWFFWRIKPEQRAQLRVDLPNAYAAFTGEQVTFGSLTWARQQRVIAEGS